MTDETITFVEGDETAISPGERWSPLLGDETLRFLEKKPEGMRHQVEQEARAILSRSTRPGEVGTRAGLVLGYVQSGKTTSFTAAATLAADNGYGLVIILGGTSKNLLDQTRRRLSKELDLESLDAYERWVSVESPKPSSPEAETLRVSLEEFIAAEEQVDRVPVMVTIMKQWKHLQDLSQLMEELDRSVDLSKVTALVIDDEADQATPNIKDEGEESVTYAYLKGIRKWLPSHTLLQYTATPQAPLLVSLADEISPDFVCVLEPGKDYVGGKDLFLEHRGSFVESIPIADLPASDPKVEVESPPTSFCHAFATYVLGCVIADRGDRSHPSQISMLVHPSQRTAPHERFRRWIEALKDDWQAVLALDPTDDDRIAVIEEYFEPAYKILGKTVKDIPMLEDLLAGQILKVLPKVFVRTVQGGSATSIDFSKGRYWVLIGGQLLDRGFTVEGLTVTYMPRALGEGNADTLQQRARFFGYKGKYVQLCRAWLADDVADAFSSYVRHEERLRSDLRTVATSGASLKDWRRVFFLDESMRPTRKAVIRTTLHDPLSRREWFQQSHFPEIDDDLIVRDRELVDEFLSHLVFNPSVMSGPEPTQTHEVASTNLTSLLEEFLAEYQVSSADSDVFTAVRVLLREVQDPDDQFCEVVRIASGLSPTRRRRTVTDGIGRIKALMQGQNPKTGSGAIKYVGDRKVRSADRITLQVHRLDLTEDDKSDEGVVVKRSDVPVLAIWVPEAMRERVLLEAAR